MNYTYKIVTGDWGGDGHDSKEYYHFKCNKSKSDIISAYLKAASLAGVRLDSRGNPKEVVCDECEDSQIPADKVAALKNIGVTFKDRGNIFNTDGSLSVGGDDLVNFFLEMVNTQLPEFEYKMIDDNIEQINGHGQIGQIGYGCYY